MYLNKSSRIETEVDNPLIVLYAEEVLSKSYPEPVNQTKVRNGDERNNSTAANDCELRDKKHKMWRRENPSHTEGLHPAARTLEVEGALNARRFCNRPRIRIVLMKRHSMGVDLR